MWCVPELTEEYITKMEDVLEVYEAPLNPKEPVVCLDEKPVTLQAGKRDGTANTSDAGRRMFSAQ